MSIRTNTAYNLAGALVPLVAAIVTVPLYLRIIGIERYGVMSLFWVLLGYFGLFDFGLGRSVSQRLATLAQGSDAERSDIFWTGLFVSLAIGGIGTALLVPVSGFMLHLVKLETSRISVEIFAATPLLAITLPITLIGSIFSGALTGRERFAAVNLIEGVTNILLSVAPLGFALWLGPALPHLITGSLAIRILSALVMFWACRDAVPLRRPTRPRRATVTAMLRYGGWVTVETAVGVPIDMGDRFVIGAMLSAAAVSVYVIPSNLVLRLLIIPQALTRALFPRFAKGSEEEALALSIRSIYGVALLLTLPTISLIALIEPLMRLWVGATIATRSAPIARILLPAIYANGFGLVLFFYLQARGRPDDTAKLHLAELLPYVALLYVGIRLDGVRGAALVWATRAIVDAGLLAWLARVPAASISRLLSVFLLVTGSAVAASILPFRSPWYWLLQLAILAIAGALSWILAPPDARAQVRGILDRLRSRGPVGSDGTGHGPDPGLPPTVPTHLPSSAGEAGV